MIRQCLFNVHAGAGGTESCDWATYCISVYAVCGAPGFKIQIMDFQAGDEAGIKSVSLLIQGPYAYGLLKSEQGCID